MVTNESSALQTPAVWTQHTIQPWTEFGAMLLMGAMTILILGKIYHWKSISLLASGVEPKVGNADQIV
jgi:hypothetical protein